MISPPSLVKRPIFIMGPGRSGTTLLRSLLSAHSQICITPETHFMNRAEDFGLQSGAPADFESFWDEYTSWVRFQDLGVEASRCRELIDLQGDHTFHSIFRAVLTAYLEASGKARVGEKTPGHTRYVRYLLKWFPDARIIVTQRDPRAVVASQLRTPWVQQRLRPLSLRNGVFSGKRLREVAFYAENWAEIFEERLAPWKDHERLYIVRYEDLVQDVERELRLLCSFVGESFEPEMLSDRSPETVSKPAGKVPDKQLEQWRQKHYQRSISPISKDSLERWKEELTTTEVAMIEGRCGKTMRKAGYEPLTSRFQCRAGRVLSRTLLEVEGVEKRIRQFVVAREFRLPATLAKTWRRHPKAPSSS